MEDPLPTAADVALDQTGWIPVDLRRFGGFGKAGSSPPTPQ